MSTNYHSELERAMWALKRASIRCRKLCYHKYKLEISARPLRLTGLGAGVHQGVVMPFIK
jgi:hypothetical protein